MITVGEVDQDGYTDPYEE